MLRSGVKLSGIVLAYRQVQDMPPQTVALGEQGVSEFSGVAHPKLLHDADRSRIRGNSEGDDALQAETMESEFQRGAGGFCSVAVSPMLAR